MVKVKLNREILSLLEQTATFVTAKELSEELNVSTKTIYRAVDQINKKVGDPKLIVASKGKGIRLNQDRSQDQLTHIPDTNLSVINSLSPSRRREQVLLRLLYVSPHSVKISSIYEQFYVSDSVINNDEKVMENWLGKFSLNLQRANRQISIVGNEESIRRAISALTDVSGVIDFNNIFSKSNVSLNQRDVNFVIKLVRDAEKDLQVDIPYPYDINIFSHIYILINRYKTVGYNGALPQETQEPKKNYNFDLLHCAQTITRKIESYANIKLPLAETLYIYEYLESSRIYNFDEVTKKIPFKVLSIAEMYISTVSRLLGKSIDKGDILLDLVKHIRPMLNRLSNGIYASNELLGQIKEEYPAIFNAVRETSRIISKNFGLPMIPDGESGFISIYFAREIENDRKPTRVLITCTTGVGTAQLLKVKVNNSFPNFIIDDVFSIGQYQEKKHQYQDVDFIISTVPFENSPKVPVVVVSALFNQRDQEAIRRTINATNEVKI